VKKCLRKDKRAYVDKTAADGERAAGQRIMREVYDITKKLSRKYKKPNIPIRDKKRTDTISYRGSA
jgi:hypothetical protein